MATSSSMPATPPSLTDLPSDLLHEIVKIVNESDDSSLIVGPDLASLVLSHSSFSDPAETLLAKHQDYINTYRNIIIDANNEPFSSRDSHLAETIDRLNITSSSAEGNNTITFQSPVMMLVGMHKNKAIPNYVRSLVYLAPASGSDEALSCSQTALELFESKEIEDDWDKRLSATMDDILPDGAAAEEETLSLQSLSEGHKGKCITLLLHSLPHLTSLSLSGDERYFTVKTRYTIGFGVRTPTKFRSSIRRLVVTDVTSVLGQSDHLPQMFPHLEDIEIHCTSPELEWFGFHETSGFLYFPKIKITGYRQNPVCLAIAIASGSDSRWTTFECIFNIQIKGGLPKFIAKYHDAFTSPRFQRPNFSKTAGGCIKMVLTAKENSNNHTKDQKHYHRLYSDNDLRLAANLYGVGELLESQPIPKDFLKLLVEHNQTGHHEYKVKHEWRGRGPKSIFDTGRYFRCPVAASSTSGTFADHDRLELQNHILRNWNR